MEDAESTQISPSGLKHFVRHLCVVSKQYHEKEKAHESLHRHVKRMKKLSSKKRPSKKLMENEFKKLNRRIKTVIEKESKLLRHQKADMVAMNELKSRIDLLEKQLLLTEKVKEEHMVVNKQKIDNIGGALFDLRSKLEYLADIKKEREDRVTALESRIRRQFSAPDEKKYMMQKKLKSLEVIHKKMLKSKKYSRAKLKQIKHRIESSKRKLGVIARDTNNRSFKSLAYYSKSH